MQSTERLAELIARKHQVLVQLHELGRRQGELIETGDTTLLLRLLSVKQTLIGALQESETALGPYRDENPDDRVWASAEHRERCAAQAAACNELLREIVSMEQHGADSISERRDQIANQLQEVHHAAQVRGAYESHRRPASQRATA